MLNRALLVGRLTRDPELRRTSNGKAVTSFNLAVERNFKSDDQEADFINCVCWGKIAENTERYCSKGSLFLLMVAFRQETMRTIKVRRYMLLR